METECQNNQQELIYIADWGNNRIQRFEVDKS